MHKYIIFLLDVDKCICYQKISCQHFHFYLLIKLGDYSAALVDRISIKLQWRGSADRAQYSRYRYCMDHIMYYWGYFNTAAMNCRLLAGNTSQTLIELHFIQLLSLSLNPDRGSTLIIGINGTTLDIGVIVGQFDQH